MTITADHVHWGIAAYVFSLDLGTGLAPLVDPSTSWDAIRKAARTAILENRQVVEAGGAPLMLRDTMTKALRNDDKTGSEAAWFEWVETRFVTAARPRNGTVPLLTPLREPSVLARVDAELGFPSPEATSYAAMLHSCIEPAAANQVFDAVFEVDAMIDLKTLSDWDQSIIARNADTHAPESPLAPLIYSLVQDLLIAAADRVLDAIGPDRTQRLRGLCSPKGGL